MCKQVLTVLTALVLACSAFSGEPAAGEKGSSEAVRAVVVLQVEGPGSLELKAGSMEFKTPFFVVALVEYGQTTSVKVVPGLVVRTREGWTVLQLRYHAAVRETDTGSIEELWVSMFSRPLSKKDCEWRVVDTTLADVPNPDEDAAGQTWSAEGNISLEALMEGQISYVVTLAGYQGGAHPFDSSMYVTRDPVDLGRYDYGRLTSEWLGPLAMDQLKKVDEERKSRGDDPIDAKVQDVFLNGAFVPDWASGKYVYRSIVYCCTWAENHNQYDFEVAVPANTKPLDSFGAPRFVAPGEVEGPDGWRLSLTGDSLLAGPQGLLKPMDLGTFKVQKVLAVYWLKPGEAIDLNSVPGPVVKEQ